MEGRGQEKRPEQRSSEAQCRALGTLPSKVSVIDARLPQIQSRPHLDTQNAMFTTHLHHSGLQVVLKQSETKSIANTATHHPHQLSLHPLNIATLPEPPGEHQPAAAVFWLRWGEPNTSSPKLRTIHTSASAGGMIAIANVSS